MDVRRIDNEASKANEEFRKTGKLPSILRNPPGQVFLHMLPNGKARGICAWGSNPSAVAENTSNY